MTWMTWIVLVLAVLVGMLFHSLAMFVVKSNYWFVVVLIVLFSFVAYLITHGGLPLK